jgi:hypothetical protein
MSKPKGPRILKAGSLAYLDCFSGMVPVKVLSVTAKDASVRVTATRGAYRKGEVMTWRHSRVVPRSAARFGKYSTRIRPYSVEISPELTSAKKTPGGDSR